MSARAEVLVTQASTAQTNLAGSGWSLSWTHTTSGKNRLLLVGLTFGEFQLLPTATYGGQTMTLLRRTSSANTSSAVWYLVNPPLGTNTVTLGTSCCGDNWIGGAVSFANVHQTAPLNTVASATGTTSPVSVSVASGLGEVVYDHVAAFEWIGPAPTLTAGAGQTQHYMYAGNYPSQDDRTGAGSTKVAGAATTMSWTYPAQPQAVNWATVAVSAKPTAEPSPVTTSAATSVTSSGATLNGSATPNGLTATGYFRYSTTNPGTCNDTFGTRAPASGGTALGSGWTSASYSTALTGLLPNTTYYFCALASSTGGVGLGDPLSFTTTAIAPTVTTSAASSVTSSGATLNGDADPNGSSTTGWYRYSTTNPGTCNDTFGTRAPSSGGSSLGSGQSPVSYPRSVTGLLPNTTYYFCALASNAVGTAVGTVLSFTTTAIAPSVTTNAASSVTSAGATLNGAGDPNGSTSTGWFRYATASPGSCNDTFGTRVPSTGGAALGAGQTAVAYANAVTGLLPNTTYYFCALASNAAGTGVGAVLSFTTAAIAPAVATSAATAVTSTGATLNGAGTPNGSATTGWFRYDTTSPGTCNDTFGSRVPSTGGAALGAGHAPVAYSNAVTGLLPNTTYYFCALASNAVGTVVGAVLSVTTSAVAPTVTTNGASAVTSSGATLNGSASPNGSAATGHFRYSATNPGSCNDTFGTRVPSTGGAALGAGQAPVAYSNAVTGLLPNTTYYFCALASNAAGTGLGTVLSFTTTAVVPTVSTSAATAVTSTGATLNGLANPNGSATTGWLRYDTTSPGACNDTFGTRLPATGGTALGAGQSSVAFSGAATGLLPNTTYYFCALASNGAGTSVGSVSSFTTTAVAPTVTTNAATAVSSNGATLNGSANPNGSTTTGWFRYSATNPGSCNDTFGTRTPASGGAALGAGQAPVAFSSPVGSLLPNTTYYYCALASNGVGTSLGVVTSFTTGLVAPTVTTSAATSLSSTGATLNGSANPNGSAATGWFRYSATNPGSCDDTFGTRAPSTGGASLGAGLSAVPYSNAVTGLLPNTTYYVCALASNGAGMSTGAVLTFVTQAAAPIVVTNSATSVTSTGATLNGSANPQGSATSGWFRYATANPGTCSDTFGTRAPATGSSALGAGQGLAPYSNAVTGLLPNTTYYFCALASNVMGTSVGAVQSFSTGSVAPAVTTSAATAVTSSGATLNATANPNGNAATGWFRYATVSPGTCSDSFGTRAPSTGGAALGAGQTAAPYSNAVTGLLPNTTYYFCALASNTVGTSVGTLLSFTTAAVAPAVTTNAASGVGSAAATLQGTANPRGSSTTGWFRYATASPGTCNDTFGTRSPASGGTALGAGQTAAPYSSALTGLLPNTTYYFCALASSAAGTSVGTVETFSTTAVAPAVTTNAASGVGATGATLEGQANPYGSAATGWFRYSATNPGSCDDVFGTRAPASGGAALGSGYAAANFSEAVTGLLPNTAYYFCALASNGTGLGLGAVRSFTTGQAPPLVTTTAASAVTATDVTLNASVDPMGGAASAWFRVATTAPAACDDTFGVRVPATGGVAVAPGAGAVAVSEVASGLQPNTTYHFCALASNAAGTSMGALLSLRTLTLSLGDPCTVATACGSGFCADGVCCDTACNSGCEACAQSGAVGTCTSFPSGQDPRQVCGSGVCAGACNGLGACAYPKATTCGVCRTCDRGACVVAADQTACPDALYCNGAETCAAGVCAAGTPVTCSPQGQEVRVCDEATLTCVVQPQAPPKIIRDGSPVAAVGLPYWYNAQQRINAAGALPMTFAACGGPAGFRVDARSGVVTFVPAVAATETLCVSAQNAYGQDRYTFTVVVGSAPTGTATAVIKATPTSGPAPLTVAFDSSESTPSPGATLLYQRWVFGDGRAPRSGVSATNEYFLAGGYLSRLFISDTAGASAAAEEPLWVTDSAGNLPPLVRIRASTSAGDAPLQVHLSCDCAPGTGGIVAYRWTSTDGQVHDGPSWDVELAAGRHRVRLEVLDSNGLTAHDKVELAVKAAGKVPPRCELYADPPAGKAPLTVTHRGLWSDDDGQVASVLLEVPGLSSDQPMLVTQYPSPGTFVATLKVTDDEGLTCADQVPVRVVDAAGVMPPHILSAPALFARCAEPLDLQGLLPAATGTLPIHWTADDLPAGATLDGQTGALSWVPSRDDVGVHAVTLHAHNAAGADSATFEVTVECASGPAVVGCSCGAATGWAMGVGLLGWWLLSRRRRSTARAGGMADSASLARTRG